MFCEVVRAARELRPKAILIENVKGLLRSGFRDYFDYLLLRYCVPKLGVHRARGLEASSRARSGTSYAEGTTADPGLYRARGTVSTRPISGSLSGANACPHRGVS